LGLHQTLVNEFGGDCGLRDEGLLESALAQPQATFDGVYLYPEIHDQAAAYLYHISKNHAFVDGNKRTAVAVMETFVRKNGCFVTLSNDELFSLTTLVVESKLTKDNLSRCLKGCIVKS
jgi:death on curing protein